MEYKHDFRQFNGLTGIRNIKLNKSNIIPTFAVLFKEYTMGGQSHWHNTNGYDTELKGKPNEERIPASYM